LWKNSFEKSFLMVSAMGAAVDEKPPNGEAQWRRDGRDATAIIALIWAAHTFGGRAAVHCSWCWAPTHAEAMPNEQGAVAAHQFGAITFAQQAPQRRAKEGTDEPWDKHTPRRQGDCADCAGKRRRGVCGLESKT